MYCDPESINYLNRINEYDVENLLLYVRLFYYVFFFGELYCLLQLKKKKTIYKSIEFVLQDRFFAYISAILIGMGLFIDLYRVSFNPLNYYYMMIDPRSFTYLREGLGAFTILSSFIRMFLVYVAILYYNQKKTLKRAIYVLLCSVYCILGGSKSSLLLVVIFIILLYQKCSKQSVRISNYANIKIVLSFIGIVLVSFYLMSGSIELDSLFDVINFVISYSQEAYFSAMVISDFEWDIDYVILMIKSFILTPIPRAIFEDKGFYSFYNVYWHDLYQPNSPLFHTSTYGFLAEGHMIMGFFSPVLYGLFICWLLKKIYAYFYRVQGFLGVFITLYFISRIYFFTRTSFLDPTSLWTLLIYYIISLIIFKLLQKYTNKKSDITQLNN